MAQLVVGTNSWISLADAEIYMASRYGADEFWTEDTNKVAALVTAYKKIVDSGVFSDLPDTANSNMKDAQCEMALFIVCEGADLLRRQGLQAQGVVGAGIVKETYDPKMRGQIAFPPEVLKLLEAYAGDYGTNFFCDDLTRDDVEDVN